MTLYPHGVAGWRMVAIATVSGVSCVASASAAGAPPLYTAAATEGCLASLPDAIVGLPPATPPMPPALFVFSLPPDRYPPRAQGNLGTWYGHKGEGYEGVTLSFFKNVQDARASFKSMWWLYGGRLVRNVAVAWDQSPAPRASVQRTVLGCLRVGPSAGGAPKRATPRASLASFAGYWGGHTRGLRITSGGRGVEDVNSGCCFREYHMTFQILSVSGTLTRATAAYRATSFKRFDRHVARVRVGRVGELLLRNGMVTNSLTRVFFCSNPAWGATGVCGA